MGQAEYLLEMKNISKSFPGVKALDDVHFTLKAGEVHVLLGENGAGKSTLMKVLAGAYRPDGGSIFINGKAEEIKNPRHAQKLGIGIIYQEFNLVPYMNVAQNIFLEEMPKKKLFFLDHKKMHDDAAELLAGLHMNVDTRSLITDISTAQQQMVEVAKVLTHQSKILIMDEPTSSPVGPRNRAAFHDHSGPSKPKASASISSTSPTASRNFGRSETASPSSGTVSTWTPGTLPRRTWTNSSASWSAGKFPSSTSAITSRRARKSSVSRT